MDFTGSLFCTKLEKKIDTTWYFLSFAIFHPRLQQDIRRVLDDARKKLGPHNATSLLPLILPHYLGTWPHSPGYHYWYYRIILEHDPTAQVIYTTLDTTALSWNMTPQPRFAEAIQVHHFARSRAEWHFATPSELKPKIVDLFFQHPPSTIPFTKHAATIFLLSKI